MVCLFTNLTPKCRALISEGTGDDFLHRLEEIFHICLNFNVKEVQEGISHSQPGSGCRYKFCSGISFQIHPLNQLIHLNECDYSWIKRL